jgi:hypothetical protein
MVIFNSYVKLPEGNNRPLGNPTTQQPPPAVRVPGPTAGLRVSSQIFNDLKSKSATWGCAMAASMGFKGMGFDKIDWDLMDFNGF